MCFKTGAISCNFSNAPCLSLFIFLQNAGDPKIGKHEMYEEVPTGSY
jgi:hypothetical protein